MNIEQLIADATKHIEQNYFQLPIDGQEDPIYRERVYCYELYHQLRSRWPVNTNYELSGEVDKSGHPLIRNNNLDRVKPDLLVHIPGDMRGNYTIIEVKPITANRDGIAKDLSTLTAFRRHADYEKAIYFLACLNNAIYDLLHDIRFHFLKCYIVEEEPWFRSYY